MADHIPGFCAPPAACSRRQDRRDHVDLRLQPRDRLHRGEDRRRTAHVDLHGLHALRVLDRQTAGIEGDPLPVSAIGVEAPSPVYVISIRRGGFTLLPHEDPSAPAVQLGLRPHLAGEPFRLRHLLRLAGERGGRRSPAGVFTRSRAHDTASTRTSARRAACLPAFASALPVATRVTFLSEVCSRFDLYRSVAPSRGPPRRPGPGLRSRPSPPAGTSWPRVRTGRPKRRPGRAPSASRRRRRSGAHPRRGAARRRRRTDRRSAS